MISVASKERLSHLPCCLCLQQKRKSLSGCFCWSWPRESSRDAQQDTAGSMGLTQPRGCARGGRRKRRQEGRPAGAQHCSSTPSDTIASLPSSWGYHRDQLSTALAHGQTLALSTEDRTKAQSVCCLREQTPKPCPSLHPGLPCCTPWPNAISSGHEMWHLVTHSTRGAEPGDTRSPWPCSDSTQGGFAVHLTFPGCCHPGPLPSPAHRLLCPSPAALALQRSPATNLPSISLFPAVTHLRRRQKQEGCLPSDLSAARLWHQTISPLSHIVPHLCRMDPSSSSHQWPCAAPVPFPAALQAAV